MDSLEIVIVAAGMPFAADTLKHKSLGGSESAALSLAKALKARGHIVTVFCNTPEPGHPDFIGPAGGIGSDGVRYAHVAQYQQFISQTEVDLLIAQRDPNILAVPHQARKAVLWCHDLATYHGPSQALQGYGWNMDEIWCVSNWHADQYAKVTGYPRERIFVLRNAITEQDVVSFGYRDQQKLVYAARPERGLASLVRPGGIMERLPEYKLHIAMYDNFPDHMRDFYNQLFQWAQNFPNVVVEGSLTQLQLRTLMDGAGAYVYPTDFEETSCILAQEAMERQCIFITTPKGALLETLKGHGRIYTGDAEWGSDQFCEEFANLVRETMAGAELYQSSIHATWEPRYWSHAAAEVEAMSRPVSPRPFSMIWSLIEDSDVIPAIALLNDMKDKGLFAGNSAIEAMSRRIEFLYPYLYGKETFAAYYERYFVREDSKGARVRRSQVGAQRFEAISEQVAEVADGSQIVDYGCAEGVIILDLAARFPGKNFIGIDFAQSNVDLCRKYAIDAGLTNVAFYCGSTDDLPDVVNNSGALICTEVLEHVEKPWEVITRLEQCVIPGGRMIISVPMGPWEAIGLYDKDQYWWRAHIWHINKWMLRTMFANKEGCYMSSLPGGHWEDGRALGHTMFCYDADGLPANPVDPLEKARRSRIRNTATACIISSGTDTIKRTLKSISKSVQAINIVATESHSDLASICTWAESQFPWLQVNMIYGRKIEPKIFGFDDARNLSIQDVSTDWVLWIDDDEYMVGDFRPYMRDNAFDAYAMHQHHFTCDPRGAPTQMDKPARLFRINRGFRFYGKVHEHAEKGYNGGPGFAFILPNVDIGHPGYHSEAVRRQRFERNWPFMLWDHEVNSDRHLHKFLWLRDILHRMRYATSAGDVRAAHALADEAIAYYKDNWKQWDNVGMGGEQAIAYFSEAMAFKGYGLPIQINYDINGSKGTYSGVFDSAEDATKVVMTHIQGQLDRKATGYWQ